MSHVTSLNKPWPCGCGLEVASSLTPVPFPAMVREQSCPPRDPQETHPSVLLEVGTQASPPTADLEVVL